jgi:hypothetical protein
MLLPVAATGGTEVWLRQCCWPYCASLTAQLQEVCEALQHVHCYCNCPQVEEHPASTQTQLPRQHLCCYVQLTSA